MTLWIKQLYDELVELNHPDSIIVRRAQFTQLINFGYTRDIYSGALIPMKAEYEAYASYSDYQQNKLSYSRIIPIFVCDFTNAKFFSNNPTIVHLKGEDGVDREFKTTKGYAKERALVDWWYDRINDRYTNFTFDYPSYTLYKRSPRFWRAPGNGVEAYGHEFEIRFPSYADKIEFSKEIKQDFRPCVCEKDGSLDSGAEDGPSLELITPPLSWDDSHKLVEKLFTLAKKYKARITSDGYAWHVTINLRDSPNFVLSGARFMYLVNHPDLREFWEKTARRKSKVNARTGKNYCEYYYCGMDGMDLDRWRDLWRERPINHYWATFLRPCKDAIELRICKSTLDFSVFKDTMAIIRETWLLAKSEEKICTSTFLSRINNLKNTPKQPCA